MEAVAAAAASSAFFRASSMATSSGKSFLNSLLLVVFHRSDADAYALFCSREVSMDPAVTSLPFMKDCRPTRIVATDHTGFQLSGWTAAQTHMNNMMGINGRSDEHSSAS